MLIKFLAHSPIRPDRLAGEAPGENTASRSRYLPVGPASSGQLVCENDEGAKLRKSVSS